MTTSDLIPYARHDLNAEDISRVVEVLSGEWLTTGPEVGRFEEELARRVGAPTACVSSGTAALHTIFRNIGLERGDEVISPPLTFVATQAMAIECGAKIVFSDVDEATGNIDVDHAEHLIGDRTRAIVAVDFAGHPAELDRLRDVADKHGIALVEDAAHSLGASWMGHPVGSWADATAFSLFATKNVTSGEGGAVAARDPRLLKKMTTFARQGLIRDPGELRFVDEGPWHQEVHEIGFNYRLSDIHAALGRSQLARLETFKAARSKIKARYDEAFQDLDGVSVPAQQKWADPMWHLYPLRVPVQSRRAIYDELRAHGILAQINYIPVYWHPYFADQGFRRGMCPVAENYYRREISLPIWSGLADDQVDRVACLVRDSL